MSQCYTQVVTATGKRKRCPATATTYRAGIPVCSEHEEPKAVTK